jgi:MerR family transcriptional regulator/heat shock protein HspR
MTTKRSTPKTARRVTDSRDEALFVISVAAELAGVHPQTLRMYERKGLLRPARTSGRVRRYSRRDIELVRLIQALTQEGMNLSGVEMVMDLRRELETAQARFAALQDEMERLRRRMDEEIERVRRSYRADLVPLRSAMMPFGNRRA